MINLPPGLSLGKKRKATKKKVAKKKATKKKVAKKKVAKKKVAKKKATKKKVAKKKVAKKATKKKAPAKKKVAKKKTAKKTATAKRSSQRSGDGPGRKPSKDHLVWCKLCEEFVGEKSGDYCQEHPGEWNVEWRKPKAAKRPGSRSRSSSPSGGVVVECVRDDKGKLRVQPSYGQGYTVKNVQFPRHLRRDGCRYVVDGLDDKGTHYRAVGEIVPFEQGPGGRGAAPAASPGRSLTRRPAAPGKTSVPALLLAKKWTEQCNPRGWWISEKLDGVRAYWDGKKFVSRQGNVYFAPDWFKEGLPSVPLDGELWVGRKKFNETLSIVRSQNMSDAWDRVRYLVFDVPRDSGPFEDRLEMIKELIEDAPYASAVRHYRCKGPGHLHNELASVEAKGGEGLMLREFGSFYDPRRSSTLLKVKTFHDSEARITGYYPGKGKHAGVVGGFHVETLGDRALGIRKGVKFKIGTGLSDEDRRRPPAVGTVITFRYQELSPSGTPRFASFVRVRKNPRRRPWIHWNPPPGAGGENFEDELNRHLGPLMHDVDSVRNYVYRCLITSGLPELYAQSAAGDISEGWANDDPAPLWSAWWFRPPAEDSDRPETEAWKRHESNPPRWR